ncbi:toxin glutamine deamidase domain-containing protein [Micromonospora sp. WMMD987]|uniref:toxin glutamine deamidase domain-containing protein n=1 Tax=Micromonospora sp. WMMD987 TaxID=3016089 RepID=UPI00249B23A2|nr:toxin glutamine deamidase domain-containing protein [Micromonospora sp. WMMD987]WFE96457.1 toxin glutamine deamidase domain-containing protein [Micromonospora sp. WMMD987]
MTVLPSPIPHPLDFSPWELPGWIYEALDWVVGVEWPEGNERAVWDLADQWYAVAGALTGPRADAIAAATEVRSGYGGTGAVPDAFEVAWRRLAEGDDAPLSVLLAVSTDLGRLVEECGCDIEAAKIEVWIELGILVVELLALAVAAALTAGVASPAAGAAVTASRLVIQQIFRRLTAQLAKKALRQGLREAGERAAREVVKGGMRGLGKRAVQGGLYEAGEEAGVSLATQAYQNSTGRRHGLDLADLGASAVGGLAGGAVAPLAGLGRHATGRGARVGEHFGREMTGEVLAEGAAGLATGQGVLSLEEASRAAVSGVGGAATGQADAALRARLDGRLHALADATPVSTALPGPPPSVPAGGDRADPSADAPVRSSVEAAAPTLARTIDPTPVADVSGTAVDAPSPRPQVPAEHGVVGQEARPTGVKPETPAAPPAIDQPADAAPASVAAASTPSPTLSSVVTDTATSPPTAGRSVETANSAVATPPGADAAQVNPAASATTVGGPSVGTASSPTADASSGRTASAVPTAGVPFGSPPGVAVGSAPTAGPPAQGGAPHGAPHVPLVAGSRLPAAGAGPPGTEGHGGRRGDWRFPLLEALASGPVRPPATEPVSPTPRADDEPPRPRTPQWYAARWAAEREALDRRRYQGYFEAQRHWFEDRRRRDEAGRSKKVARRRETVARRAAREAFELQREGRSALATWFQGIARQAQRDANGHQDLAEAILAGRVAPDTVFVADPADFSRINDDVAELAVGGVETGDRSALTGDDGPPPIDRSRRYGQVGGLRPPLALHQTDLERQVPRQPDGSVVRTADPRRGGWFALANDGGPQADPTRGINCLDCTLSLFETWVHGRPRVAAPRTFDGYLQGDVRRPVNGEVDGPGRVEEVTGGRFQKLFAVDEGVPPGPAALRRSVERGYRNLHDQLVLGGHGSYAFLITEWEYGGSHAWVALNQNGAVLYLDPQAGTVHERPLYTHAGRRHPDNVVGIDALILGGDARPMPLGGLARGRFSVRPDLPEHPPAPDDEQGYGDPYLNRLHLLDGPGSGEWTGPAGGNPDRRLTPAGRPPDEEPRGASDQLPPERPAGRVRESLASGVDLDGVLRAGLTPAEIAAYADASTIRRLVPRLDASDAADVASLLGDPRVVRMLDETWRDPPDGQPTLADALVRQLVQRPDLARMILATPELANSLTARPLTLHHLAAHPAALDALGSLLDEVSAQGEDTVPTPQPPVPLPTPLSPEQLLVSARVVTTGEDVRQPGFDRRRAADPGYRAAYLDALYAAAAVAQRELNRIAVDLAHDAGRAVGSAGWRRSPKDRQRAEDKVRKYRGDVSRLRDLAGAKVEFESLDDLYRGLDRLRRYPGIRIVRCDDRFVTPQESGYRDVQLVLEMSNGHLAEFRLHLAALDELAVWEHALYEVRRDLDSLARQEGRAPTRAEWALMTSILRQQQRLFWRALMSTFGER